VLAHRRQIRGNWPTFEGKSSLGKYISDYDNFASIEADPIAFDFQCADGSR